MTAVVVDDHAGFAEMVRATLTHKQHVVCVGAVRLGLEALRLVERHRPDVLVLDLYLPDTNGFELLELMQASATSTVAVIYSGTEKPIHIQRLFQLGARGYVSKAHSPLKLLGTIREVVAGRQVCLTNLATDQPVPPALTVREQEVLQHLALDRSDEEIAKRLHVSVKTVESHTGALRQKLDARTRVGAVMEAQHWGYVDEQLVWSRPSGKLAPVRCWW